MNKKDRKKMRRQARRALELQRRSTAASLSVSPKKTNGENGEKKQPDHNPPDKSYKPPARRFREGHMDFFHHFSLFVASGVVATLAGGGIFYFAKDKPKIALWCGYILFCTVAFVGFLLYQRYVLEPTIEPNTNLLSEQSIKPGENDHLTDSPKPPTGGNRNTRPQASKSSTNTAAKDELTLVDETTGEPLADETTGVPITTEQAAGTKDYIAGVVRDIETDADLQGATITMQNLNTRAKFKAMTGDDGYFKRKVPVGEYKVTVSLDGYLPVTEYGTVTKEQGHYLQHGKLQKIPTKPLPPTT